MDALTKQLVVGLENAANEARRGQLNANGNVELIALLLAVGVPVEPESVMRDVIRETLEQELASALTDIDSLLNAAITQRTVARFAAVYSAYQERKQ